MTAMVFEFLAAPNGRRRLLAVVALGVLVASSACGGDGGGGEGGASAPSAVALTTAPPTSTTAPRASRVLPAAVSASSSSSDSQDACGNPITYGPENVSDGRGPTAWQTSGDGSGQTITFQLPANTTVTRVGLVPGYDKVDSCAGTDRYAQNRRVTEVRWSFDGGEPQAQSLSVNRREIQRMAVEPVEATTVTMEIVSTVVGTDPDTDTPISEIAIIGFSDGSGVPVATTSTTAAPPAPALSPEELAVAFVQSLMDGTDASVYAPQTIVDEALNDPGFSFFQSLAGGHIGVDNPAGCEPGDVNLSCHVNVSTDGPAMIVNVGVSTVPADARYDDDTGDVTNADGSPVTAVEPRIIAVQFLIS